MLALSLVAAALAAGPRSDYTVDWTRPETVEIQDTQTYVELVASTGEFPEGVVLVVQFYPLRPAADWSAAQQGASFDIHRVGLKIEPQADNPSGTARGAVANGQLLVRTSLPPATQYEIVTWFDPNDPSNSPFARTMHRHEFRRRRYRETFSVARDVEWLTRAARDGGDLRSAVASFQTLLDEVVLAVASGEETSEENRAAWVDRYQAFAAETRTRVEPFILTASGGAYLELVRAFQIYVGTWGDVNTSPDSEEFEMSLRFGPTGEFLTPERARELAGQFDQIAGREACHLAASVLRGIYEGAETVLFQSTGTPMSERAARLQQLGNDLTSLTAFLSPESLGASWAPVFAEVARIEDPEPLTITRMASQMSAWIEDVRLAVGGDTDAQARAEEQADLWPDRLQRLRNRILTGLEVIPEAPLEGEPVEEDPEETDNP